MVTDVIIPAFNEAASIGYVITDIPSWVREIVVVDNASTDNTAEVALEHNATVVTENLKGYGSACLAGIKHIKQKNNPPDIVVFLDADYSDYPDEMDKVISPIVNNGVDLVIGSRSIGNHEKGALLPQQVFGNWLATRLLKFFYRGKFTDLGPFRAIKYARLIELNMQDTNYGWTVEMQIKALKQKLSYTEVPVRYRKRIGKSKIAGTFKGTILAGYKILYTIYSYR